MNSEIAQKIIDFITGESLEANNTAHESYCMFPWETCTCQKKISIAIDTPLFSQGLLDSFSMASLVAYLEKHFNISIPDSQVFPENFETVFKIVNLIESLS